MGSGQRFSVILTGGSPWGFRLFGGENFPLQVAKVRKKSKSDQMGMKEGDNIVSINGVSMAGKSHQDAMYIVDNSGDKITFEIFRSGSANVSQPAPVVNGYSSLQADDRNSTNLRVSPVSFGQRRSPSPYQQQMQTPRQDLRASPIGNKRSPSPYQPKVTESEYTARMGDTTAHVQTRQFQDTSADGRQTRTVFQQRQVIAQTPGFKPKQVITPTNPNIWHPVSAQKENVAPTTVPHFNVRNIKETIITSPTSNIKAGPPVPPKPLQERKNFEKNIHDFDLQDRQYIPDPCMYGHDYHFPEVRVVEDDDEIIDTHPHEDEFHHHHHHLPVFAPKVEICYEDFVNEQNRYNEEGGYDRYDPSNLPPLEIRRTTSLPESEATGPGTPDTESTGATVRKKKMYSDSAFFDNPDANYPTIEEQMELCKKIAQSLTSAANRKARGAKMFAKRKRKSASWVHDDRTFASSSAGDIADLHDLDSEFYVDEGGNKPLFTFRIPNIKSRLAVPDPDAHKMSLSQDDFERLRLNKKRCDHRVVSPNTCHSLVADLQSPKNRGAKLFQKRQARSEKWVIDESNARRPNVHHHTRLENMISPKASMSPWEAAMENPLGGVDGAFSHMNQHQVNTHYQNMRPGPLSPQPVSVPYNTPSRPKTKLQNLSELEILQGEDFNRKAKGWCPQSQPSQRTNTRSTREESFQQQTFRQEPPPAPPLPKKQDNYNRKIRAWNTGPQETRQREQSYKVSSTSESNYGTYPGRKQKKMDYSYNYNMTTSEIPGSDL